MAEGKDNEQNSWDNEAQLHMVDVCPLFTAPDSWYRDLVHYLQEGYLRNIGIPNNEEHYALNHFHIISLMEYYLERIMMEFFLGAWNKKMQRRS